MPHKITKHISTEQFSSKKSHARKSEQRANEIITAELVKKVAKFSHLHLSDSEIKSMQKDLNDILAAFKTLNKAKTEGVQPSFHPQPVRDILREDKIELSLGQEKALANTKHKQEGYFKGPRIV